MGTTATFVGLLAVLVAWSSLGHATPLPSSTTLNPITSSDASTSTEHQVSQEEHQQVQEKSEEVVAQEPVDVAQTPAELPQESNDNPDEQEPEPIVLPPFREQFPSGLMAPRNPDGQSDGIEMEMVDPEQVRAEEPNERDMAMPDMPNERDMPQDMPQDMPNERDMPQDMPNEGDMPQDMPQQEPQDMPQEEPEQEPPSPPQQQMVNYRTQPREPEEQSEMGDTDTDFIQDEDTEIEQVDFRKPALADDQLSDQHFRTFPDEDSPHFNEVEGIYANQQEGLLPQSMPVEDIPMMQFPSMGGLMGE